jgi:hypothetical protein
LLASYGQGWLGSERDGTCSRMTGGCWIACGLAPATTRRTTTPSSSAVLDRRFELICGLDLRMGRAAKNVLKLEEMRRLRVLDRSDAGPRVVGEAGFSVGFPGFDIFIECREVSRGV